MSRLDRSSIDSLARPARERSPLSPARNIFSNFKKTRRVFVFGEGGDVDLTRNLRYGETCAENVPFSVATRTERNYRYSTSRSAHHIFLLDQSVHASVDLFPRYFTRIRERIYLLVHIDLRRFIDRLEIKIRGNSRSGSKFRIKTFKDLHATTILEHDELGENSELSK